MIGQTLWSMSREEYNARYGSTEAIDNFEPLEFPLLVTDEEIEKAIQAEDEGKEIDWLGITRAFG